MIKKLIFLRIIEHLPTKILIRIRFGGILHSKSLYAKSGVLNSEFLRLKTIRPIPRRLLHFSVIYSFYLINKARLFERTAQMVLKFEVSHNF